MADVTPHLAFPLRCINGRFQSVEQRSTRHLQDQAEVLTRTRPGMIEHAPELGLRDLAHRLGPAAPEIAAVLERFVPEGLFALVENESELQQRIRTVIVDVLREDQGQT